MSRARSGGAWDWLFGFYYFDENLKAETFSYDSLTAGNPQDGYAFQTQDARSWALFGSLDFRPTDRWTLKGGLRYTTDKKDFSAERPDPTFQLPTVRPIEVSTDADLVTWDLSTTYKATENVNLYGRVGTGFRAPSIQGRILFCADFEGGLNPATNCVSVAHEEKLISFEAGVKTQVARKLRLNVDGFVYNVDGQQIVAVGGQYNTATLLNADKTKGYGFEADLDWAPVVPLAHHRWAPPTTTPRSTTRTSRWRLAAAAARSRAPSSTDWRASTATRCRTPRSGSSAASSTTGDCWAARASSRRASTSPTTPRRASSSTSRRSSSATRSSSARASGTRSPGAASRSPPSARNLLDEVIVQNGIDFDNLTGMTNEPRMIGVELVTKF